jgi:hypothetical protein
LPWCCWGFATTICFWQPVVSHNKQLLSLFLIAWAMASDATSWGLIGIDGAICPHLEATYVPYYSSFPKHHESLRKSWITCKNTARHNISTRYFKANISPGLMVHESMHHCNMHNKSTLPPTSRLLACT